jgi:hypothetical protein
MRGVCGSIGGRAGRLLVVLLALVPVLASGHYHSANASRAPDSCPACMVKSDSPAVTAPPAPQLAPLLCRVAVVPSQPAVPGFAVWPSQSARAPPLHTPIRRA